MTSTPSFCRLVIAVGSTVLLLNGSAAARTIVLTDEDCEKMACISAESPKSGWAAMEAQTSTFTTAYLEFFPGRNFLIRFPIERIPKGQKITKAELQFVTNYQGAAEQRLYLRRVLVDWGVGVCWQYRMQRPKKLEWSQPGCAGATKDRAARATAVIRSPASGEKLVNVTEDVELWYTGASKNYGWSLSLEDQEGYIRVHSPLYPPGRGSWKLRVTYEPE